MSVGIARSPVTRRQDQPARRDGFTLVELLVVIAIIGLIVALLLPAVQQSRESARRIQCQSNLKQVGLAIQNYHDTFSAFPSGYIGENPDPLDTKGWGWAALLLPLVEQGPLHSSLNVEHDPLGRAVNDSTRRPLLLTSLNVFLCPSDSGGTYSHQARALTGFPFPVGTGPITAARSNARSRFHPGNVPAGIRVDIAKSNYVGSFGDGWDPNSGIWTLAQLRGNGVFGCNSATRFSNITDGTSHTFAVGERSWKGYAAVWAGVEQWSECTSHGLTMVLGTAFYKPNIAPQTYTLSCDGLGSAGFGSRHPGGSQFVMCDGSIRFVSDSIDFNNSINPEELGVFQKLGRRNDGESVDSF